MMTCVDPEPAKGQVPDEQPRHPAGRRSAPWRALGAGAGVLGGEGLTACFHSELGEALAAADVVIPSALVIILLTAILRGNSQTCERVFRLLRWIANRPEPPVPGSGKPG